MPEEPMSRPCHHLWCQIPAECLDHPIDPERIRQTDQESCTTQSPVRQPFLCICKPLDADPSRQNLVGAEMLDMLHLLTLTQP
jgi:hypothetical protein